MFSDHAKQLYQNKKLLKEFELLNIDSMIFVKVESGQITLRFLPAINPYSS